MSQRCLNCKHWCGTKYSKWGDCQYIVHSLCPQLSKYKNVFGWRVAVPFDPQSIKYHVHKKYINKLLLGINLPDDVRRDIQKQKTVTFSFSPEGTSITGERGNGIVMCVFFQTKCDKGACNYYERSNGRSRDDG